MEALSNAKNSEADQDRRIDKKQNILATGAKGMKKLKRENVCKGILETENVLSDNFHLVEKNAGSKMNTENF